ncbi:MAG: 1-acyl-sn-glycerol-3-phosphate acyltransferase [Colwellia sp.]|nr:1-acyl-sn-glycerol-3-phosphate acyltransferase [Colwellia sp.]
MLPFILKKYRMYLAIAAQSIALSLCRRHGKIFNYFRHFFTVKVVRSAGATIKFIGSINDDTDILIANHQTMTDIFVLEEIIGNDARFVGRTGIMDKWPVSVIVNRVEHITVDKQDKRAIIKLLTDIKACKGKKVIIFPEGTRSQSGKIEPFEGGTKLIIEKLKLKAQPIVIKNTLSIYNESAKTAKNGVIEVEALPAITLEEGWYEKAYKDMNRTFITRQT